MAKTTSAAGQFVDAVLVGMNEQQRKNTCKNTAKALSIVKYPEIQKKYLAQIYNIAHEYSQGVYDLLSNKSSDFSEVEKLAEGAQLWYKEKKFQPSYGGEVDGLCTFCFVLQCLERDKGLAFEIANLMLHTDYLFRKAWTLIPRS